MKSRILLGTVFSLSLALCATLAGQQFQPNPTFQYPQVVVPQTNVISHWTQQLNGENRGHDFGTVPSYSDHSHIFEFKNNFDYPVHLTGLRTSCSCTISEILTKTIGPGEIGKIKATFDTKNHYGKKQATVTISVKRDQPYTEYGEVQFQVKGVIRRDVVLSPGTVCFDKALVGKSSKKTVLVRYAGNPNWKIMSAKSTNPNISIETREVARDLQTQRIDYELTLTLDGEQEIGPFVDQVLISTNDLNQKNRNLAVNIHGKVHSVVKVAPVRLGVIERGQKIKKNLVIKGERPFGIESVICDDDRVSFEAAPGSKTLHVLKYKLDTTTVGKLSTRIKIMTDDPVQREAMVPIDAQIVPATFAGGNGPE